MTAAIPLSVLLPVYNVGPYLADTLDSLLNQTFADFELLAHDDGSTDNSLEILHDYAARDPRLKITTGSNQGIVKTLNQLAGAAQSDLLARIDGDDICRADRFEKQVAFLKAHPETGVLGSFVTCIDSENRPICDFTPPQHHDEIDNAHIKSGGPCIWHPAVMMRAQALKAAGGYSTDYPHTEDYALWLRMGEITRLANFPEPLVCYRLHLESVSVTKRDIQVNSAARAWKDACDRRGISPEPPSPRHAPEETEVMQKWAWWAISAGHRGTARHYAMQVFRRQPFALSSLRLLRGAWRL